MTPLDRQLGLRLLNLHQFIYERSGGLIGHRLGDIRMLLLRTQGRRSGERRTAGRQAGAAGRGHVEHHERSGYRRTLIGERLQYAPMTPPWCHMLFGVAVTADPADVWCREPGDCSPSSHRRGVIR